MHQSTSIVLTMLALGVLSGCTKPPPPQRAPQTKSATQTSPDLRTVRLRFEGFTKSKSGAT